jgi:hypothetical protein
VWTFSHSVTTPASPEALFRLYRDVDTWPTWDAGLERVQMDGPFVTGTTGTMYLRGQDPLPWRLAWVEPGRGFEDETRLPDAELVVWVRHELDPLPGGGTRVTYSLRMDGPTIDTLGPELGPAITGDFPHTMAALAARAEALDADR